MRASERVRRERECGEKERVVEESDLSEKVKSAERETNEERGVIVNLVDATIAAIERSTREAAASVRMRELSVETTILTQGFARDLRCDVNSDLRAKSRKSGKKEEKLQ